MKIQKKQILALFSIFLVIGVFTAPHITSMKTKVIETELKSFDHIQQSVNQYYQKNGNLPSMEQVEIGKPSPLSITQLGEKNITYRYSLWVDAYGEVYDLPNSFLPPKEVEIIYNSENKKFLRWSSVESAEQYQILKVSKTSVENFKRLFGQTSVSLMSLATESEVATMHIEEFAKEGEYYLYPLPEDENITYLVVAYSNKYGFTPAKGAGN